MTLVLRAAAQSQLPAGAPAPTDRVIPLIASSDAIDSYDEVVDQKSWDLSRFQKNPVALIGHAPWEPAVGFYRNVRVEDNELRADLVLYTEDINPESERIWKRYLQGGPIAFSVGFDCRRKKKEKRGNREVTVLYDNTLTEISVVTIGANPDAVAEARKKHAARLRAVRTPPRKDRRPMSLKSVLASKGMTPEACAAAAELPLETMTALMADDAGPPSDEQMTALAKGLGMTVDELLPMLLDEADDDVELEALPAEEALAAKSLMKTLGAKSMAEAAVKIRAMQENRSGSGDMAARLGRLEKTASQRERDDLLEAARRDSRLTPAREKKNKTFLAGLSNTLLKSYLATLDPVLGDPGQPQAQQLGEMPKVTRAMNMPSDADLAEVSKRTGQSVESLKKAAAALAARNAQG